MFYWCAIQHLCNSGTRRVAVLRDQIPGSADSGSTSSTALLSVFRPGSATLPPPPPEQSRPYQVNEGRTMNHHSKSESKPNSPSNAEPNVDRDDPLTTAQRDFACFLGRVLA